MNSFNARFKKIWFGIINSLFVCEIVHHKVYSSSAHTYIYLCFGQLNAVNLVTTLSLFSVLTIIRLSVFKMAKRPNLSQTCETKNKIMRPSEECKFS